MEPAQRAQQGIIALWAADAIPQKSSPSAEQLRGWTRADEYGVWINGKRIDNATLSQYESSDFAKFHVSRLHPNARNYGKHEYQVDLQTQEYFEARTYGAMSRNGGMEVLIKQHPLRTVSRPKA